MPKKPKIRPTVLNSGEKLINLSPTAARSSPIAKRWFSLN